MKICLLSIIILLVLTGSSFAQTVLVHPGSCLKIGPGSTLDLGSGTLKIASDSLSTASLIDLGNLTHSGGGNTEVQQFITPGKWHLIASPIVSAEAGMFLDDYLQQFNEPNSQWNDILSINTPLEVMKGYSVWSTAATSTMETYSGESNTGTFQVNFSKNGNGFNLLGNPYPSSINWDQVTIPPGLNGQFYLWDPSIGSNGDYVYYIEGGGPANTTSQFIPSGQGFFVEANSSGVLNLDNSVRVHSNQPFYKQSNSIPMILLKVSGNGITTQTAIRFSPEASENIDRMLDVRKILSGNEDIPNLYSYAAEEKMAINTLPEATGNEVIPLGFSCGTNGEYQIRTSELESHSENFEIMLEDVEKNSLQDLRKQSLYTFPYTQGSEKLFRLHLKKSTGIPGTETATVPFLSCTISDDMLRIRLNDEIVIVNNQYYILSVFDLSGQKLLESRLRGTDNTIPFQSPPAVYLVRITCGNNVYTTKVIHP